jgi:hypothetical protein
MPKAILPEPSTVVATGQRTQHGQRRGTIGNGLEERRVGLPHSGEGLLSHLGTTVGDPQLPGPGVDGIHLAPDQRLPSVR